VYYKKSVTQKISATLFFCDAHKKTAAFLRPFFVKWKS